jgi:hypothetical protein
MFAHDTQLVMLKQLKHVVLKCILLLKAGDDEAASHSRIKLFPFVCDLPLAYYTQLLVLLKKKLSLVLTDSKFLFMQLSYSWG